MRNFTDENGSNWQVEVISDGRTSDYLNPRVHKPILAFKCLDRRGPRRYTSCPLKEFNSLDEVPEGVLREWLGRAVPH